MKLKHLFIALLGVQLTACATQPISQNTTLSQKVYRGYEHLVGKESYAFDGRAQFSITPSQANQQVTNKEHDSKKSEQEKQQLISKVFGQQKLPNEQLKWMLEGLDQLEQPSYTRRSANQIPPSLQSIVGRFYYDYSGVVNLSQGQMSFDSKLGYGAKNAEAWLKVPLALDFKKEKAYADFSAFSPLLTDPAYDGRYIVFDFSKFLKDLNLDKKAILEFMREYMLVNPAMAQETDYQALKLTDIERKLNAVEKVRYMASYEEISAQYLLFFYLNEKYLANKIDTNKNLQTGVMGSVFGGIANPKKVVDVFEQATSEPEVASLDKTATAARIRLETALELVKERLREQDRLEEEKAHEAEMAAMEADSEENDDIATEKDLLTEALTVFDQYRSEQKSISALEMKNIVAQHPQAYEDLIKGIKEPLSEFGVMNQPMIIDMSFDDKGRMVRSEMKMDLGMQAWLSQDIKMQMTADFHSYGQAKIDQNIFKQAVSFSEVSKNGTIFSKDDSKQGNVNNLESSQSWSEDKRYSELAKSLLDQNISFIDAYATVYRYAYLLNYEIEDEEDFDAKEILNTARWNAIYYAKEYDLGVTKAQSLEYDNSPDEWSYYDEELADEIWSIFYDLMDERQYQVLYQQLKPKYTNNAELFSAIYSAADERKEKQKLDSSDSVEYPEGFDNFVKLIGEIASEDLKSQTINQQKLDQFTWYEVIWFEPEIYEQTYEQFLKK